MRKDSLLSRFVLITAVAAVAVMSSVPGASAGDAHSPISALPENNAVLNSGLAGVPMPGAVSANTLVQTSTTWDLATALLAHPDMNPAPDGSFPGSGIWQYAETPTLEVRGNYNLLSSYTTTSGNPALSAWYDSRYPSCVGTDVTYLPYVMINTSADPVDGCASLEIPGHAVVVHPLDTRNVAIGWKSPVNGQVKVMGTVTKLDSGPVDWSLVRGCGRQASVRQTGTDANGPSSINKRITVAEGECINLVISKGDDYYGDTTQVELSITLV